jgi:nucleoside-diphosphate-sugar epimerase
MILVLGQSGYLGSLLLESRLIREGIQLCKPGFSTMLHDLSDKDLADSGIRKDFIQTVIVAASKPKLSKWTVAEYETNVKIAQGVIKHFKHSKVVFLSSADVYGTSPKIPIRETSPLLGNTLYAKSKIRSEEIFQSEMNSENLAIFRLPGVYGGSKKAHGLMDLFVRSARDRRPIVLDSQEVLSVKRDWVYGPDIVEILNQFIVREKFQSGTFNLISGDSISIYDWISAAERVANCVAQISFRDPIIHHEIFNLIFDDSNFKNLFPLFKFTTAEQASFY